MGVKIGLVWFVSLLVTSPLIVIGFVHPEEIMSTDDLQCSITNRPFLVYGSIAAYFFPLGVMLVAYTASIRLLGRQGAWSRLRRGAAYGSGRGDDDGGLRRSRSGRQTTSVPPSGARTPSELYVRRDDSASRSAAGSFRSLHGRDVTSDCVHQQSSSTSQHDRSLSPLLSGDDDVHAPSTSETPSSMLVGTGPTRCGNEVVDNAISDSGDAERGDAPQSCGGDADEHGRASVGQEVTSLQPSNRKSREHVSRDDAVATTPSIAAAAAADDDDDDDDAGSPGLSVARGRRLRSLVRKHALTIGVACELLSRRDVAHQRRSQVVATAAAAAAAAMRNVRTERKAARVIGAVFAVFVACWTPFFVLNVSLGVCGPACRQPVVGLYSVFLWLGYAASTLNPIVYTAFNGTFRCTFADLLTCRRRPCSASRAQDYAESGVSRRRRRRHNSAV